MHMDKKELAAAVTHWLEYMRLSNYRTLFSKSLLIIPIAEYLRGHRWDVVAETDCDELLEIKDKSGTPKRRGLVNYDVYAKAVSAETKSILSTVIIEMKFIKEGDYGYARLITDFVKLAIPPKDTALRRIALIARERPLSTPPWLSNVMNGKGASFKFERSDNTVSLSSAAGPLPNDKSEKTSIATKLEAYDLATLELGVECELHEIPGVAVEVIICSITRET